MIEKLNIPIQSKNTKKIEYCLSLDNEWWHISELDKNNNEIYYVNSKGNWVKKEYNNRGDKIYVEDKHGFLNYDRTN